MNRRYVIIGASRGIGAAVALHLETRGADLVAVSRTRSAAGRWIAADVATDAGIDAVVGAVSDDRIDGLLYLGGVWETNAFTDRYCFADSPRAETRFVLDVNLVAPILLAQALTPNLALSDDPRIILIGSLSGLDNAASPEVANTASKFGLRGAAQALALALRPAGVGVTLINPGNVATREVEEDIRKGDFSPQTPIPLADIARTVDYVLSLSRATTPTEINLAQRMPG